MTRPIVAVISILLVSTHTALTIALGLAVSSAAIAGEVVLKFHEASTDFPWRTTAPASALQVVSRARERVWDLPLPFVSERGGNERSASPEGERRITW